MWLEEKYLTLAELLRNGVELEEGHPMKWGTSREDVTLIEVKDVEVTYIFKDGENVSRNTPSATFLDSEGCRFTADPKTLLIKVDKSG